jgi:hypothetical protein
VGRSIGCVITVHGTLVGRVLGKDGGERFGGIGRVKNEPGAFSSVTRQVTASNRNRGNSMADSLSRGTRAAHASGFIWRGKKRDLGNTRETWGVVDPRKAVADRLADSLATRVDPLGRSERDA